MRSFCTTLLAAHAGLAAAHAGMTSPLPRNSFGYPIPTGPDADPHQALPKYFSNYYDDGCLVGCDSCLHHGAAVLNETMNPWASPVNVECTVGGKPVGGGVFNITLPGADTLPAYARTWNRIGDRLNASPLGDWNVFQPWRAPGKAVIEDPCGLLCDHCSDPDDPSRPILFNGTALPPLSTPPTRWKAGGVAEAAWALMVNHGGGYREKPALEPPRPHLSRSPAAPPLVPPHDHGADPESDSRRAAPSTEYRLCKKGQPMTEACFQAGALEFADRLTTIRYTNGSVPEFTIPAIDVREGVVPVGSTWRRDPIPACACDAGLNCRYNGGTGRNTSLLWLEGWNQPYRNVTDGPPGCVYGTMFEPAWPQGYGHIAERVDVGGGAQPTFDYEMVDRLRVPMEKGEYLLSWRWDTEQKGQVWSACSDIVVE